MSRNKALLFTVIILLLAGCAPFTAEPSTFTFKDTLWIVGSAKLASELSFPPVKPTSASDVLLIVQFDVKGTPVPRAEAESLRVAFGAIVLSETGKKPDQFYPWSKEQNGPVESMFCVFSVPKETTSAKLILPDSQIITLTLKR
jgi:hypothetical protein